MERMKSMRPEDQPEVAGPLSPGSVDPTPFLGVWLSTNSKTPGIAKLIITGDDDGLMVHAYGSLGSSLCDWGEVRGAVFADGVTSKRGLAFSALYDFGFKVISLQAKVKKGVLVVASFNRFKDNSGRSNYFSREFFYTAPAENVGR